MRIDINLASQPYEDARQFWMRWGTALGVLGLLTLVLLSLDISGWMGAHRDRVAMSEKRDLIAQRDQLLAEAGKILNLPENRTTRDQSQYLNGLIERKAFSWTRVLEDLERVMPARVHLVSISPQLDEYNELALKMTVAGDSWDRAVELAKRMEESHRFVQTAIIRATHVEQQNGDNEQFEMAAIYIPTTPGEPAAGSHSTNTKTGSGVKPRSEASKTYSAKKEGRR